MARARGEAGECAGELTWQEARARLAVHADEQRAEHLQRFFKTGKGGYGEGDRFIGLRVPEIRAVAREFRQLRADETMKLLQSEIHEERLLGLLILVDRYGRGDEAVRREVFESYLAARTRVDNWDLVDASAPYIFGRHVAATGAEPERLRLAQSPRLWDRRIAIVSTLHSIRAGDTEIVWKLAAILLNDEHDLIHKAVGWMLREAGKKDALGLRRFLDEHAATMPRTMLRYALERLPATERAEFMGRRAEA